MAVRRKARKELPADEAKALPFQKVYGPQELQVYWTRVMDDEGYELRERLKASEMLARSHGMFSDTMRHELNVDFAALLREIHAKRK
jgi:hypothetical protein